MKDVLMHRNTAVSVDRFINNPSHAVILTGTVGSGKGFLARYICSRLLDIDMSVLEKYKYFLDVSPVSGKSIGIDEIRGLRSFVKLKVPIANKPIRIILIENAQLMTVEAQNAILKLIEEPPASTLIIMTTEDLHMLLPTIVSRSQFIRVLALEQDIVKVHYKQLGYSEDSVDRAWLVSGGLLGLMNALLEQNQDHPLVKTTSFARELLGKNLLDRLLSVDDLAKNQAEVFNLLFILQQMAHLALLKQAKSESTERWKRILATAYDCQSKLASGAQTKLVLSHLMLNI